MARLGPPFIARAMPDDKEKLKCPAEENANCGKSPPTNARKSCGKTDTRINRSCFRACFTGPGQLQGAVFEKKPFHKRVLFLKRLSFCFLPQVDKKAGSGSAFASNF
jgi:hypothetical protein